MKLRLRPCNSNNCNQSAHESMNERRPLTSSAQAAGTGHRGAMKSDGSRSDATLLRHAARRVPEATEPLRESLAGFKGRKRRRDRLATERSGSNAKVEVRSTQTLVNLRNLSAHARAGSGPEDAGASGTVTTTRFYAKGTPPRRPWVSNTGTSCGLYRSRIHLEFMPGLC